MKEYKTDNLNLFHMDNMELMKKYEDNHFDLAIVDPPYGIGEDGLKNHSRGKAAAPKLYTPKKWDSSAPDKEYFIELKRVSKNVIIWGANHFIEKIPNANSSSWLIWDKQNGDNDFADCEMAYSSFKTAVRKFTFRWSGMLQGDMKNKEIRIHPTQKPAALYKWILKNYAKPNDKILDTHLGSASIAVACENGIIIDNETIKFNLTGCELDEEYFDNMCKRIEAETQQLTLF